MDAHIRVGGRYIYRQLDWQFGHYWLRSGDEVICKDKLPDVLLHCEVETLDRKYSGQVHVLSLKLAGDLSRK